MFTENVSRLRRLVEGARHAEKPLVFSIPGSGLSAISAVKGGIPFLVVLNSGIYRISGVNSYASFLPFGNANEQTEELIRSQILPRCPQTPLVAGMLVGDPHARNRNVSDV
ncbi:phosphoenolpyruvate hydrolase family protein [Bilophila wadsworthia]|uniref:phosphoenolpyruvate hydrolase family protein n=1 Tax=Bilophila wadsworthia TaxID=35833 RepID=UPI00399CF048